ncbi:hypothetical protein V1502_02335 [Bacillus sp. SCS-153A]|uniref:hypothetical protein n=1 Tax=Rossellomorea sedimentorum TaxID=3115294 RepID=UPI003905A97C
MIRVSMLLILLLLLSGCRVEWSLSGDSTGNTAAVPSNGEHRPTKTGNDPLSVFLNGDVDYEGTVITLIGYPELHQGTVLKVQLREYPEDASLRGISNGTVEPHEVPVFEQLVEVDGEGNFTLEIDREEDKIYSISVEFNPEKQSDAVKEVYGARGEKIVIASNIERYEHNGETMIGVKASSYIGYPPGWGYLE